MWKSEKDMLRDFVKLNGSNQATNEELSNIFYCNKEKYILQNKSKKSLQFIDPRNGEILKEEELLCASPKSQNIGKGRGKIIKSIRESPHQLQKQLRMAKPIGSSNEIIESCYQNYNNLENHCDSEISSCSTSSQRNKVSEIEHDKNLNTEKNLPTKKNKKNRVKAVRNSRQNNALIMSLSSS